jgi:hypothetical protein
MKRNTLKKIFTAVFFVLFMTLVLAVSWIGTCGFVYLITLCFDLQFKWGVATGIWLILCLVGPILKPRVTVKK